MLRLRPFTILLDHSSSSSSNYHHPLQPTKFLSKKWEDALSIYLDYLVHSNLSSYHLSSRMWFNVSTEYYRILAWSVGDVWDIELISTAIPKIVICMTQSLLFVSLSHSKRRLSLRLLCPLLQLDTWSLGEVGRRRSIGPSRSQKINQCREEVPTKRYGRIYHGSRARLLGQIRSPAQANTQHERFQRKISLLSMESCNV